jgi:hypothetical protein
VNAQNTAQALRAAGVMVFSLLAALAAATCVIDLADKSWLAAAVLAGGGAGMAGNVRRCFRAYVRHSPRHRGLS